MKSLLDLVRTTSDMTTKQYGISALTSLCQSVKNSILCVKEGGVDVIVELLNLDDTEILQRLTGTIWNLAIVPENKAILTANETLMSRLYELIKHEDQDVKGNCSVALSALGNEEQNAQMLRDSGALGSILELLNSEDTAVLANACGSLWSLCQNPENRKQIAGVEGVNERLVQILDCGASETIEKCIGCILTLSMDVEVGRQYRDLDIVEKLLPMLSVEDNIEIVRNAIIAYGMLTYDGMFEVANVTQKKLDN